MTAQAPFIHNQSTLAVIATFVEVLRDRFSVENNTPWTWTGDPNTSSIFIYSMYDHESEAENLVPKIVVARGPMANRRVVIGDGDQNQPGILRNGSKYFFQLADCSMSVQCIAETIGESELLADIVQASISGAEDLIAKVFTLRELSPLLTQPPQPYDRDTEKWMTEVEFRVNLERRWFTIPISMPLRRYDAQMSFVDAVGDLVVKMFSGEDD